MTRFSCVIATEPRFKAPIGQADGWTWATSGSPVSREGPCGIANHANSPRLARSLARHTNGGEDRARGRSLARARVAIGADVLIAARFHAGLADDQTLVGLFGSIIQRPDFVQPSLTLPRHPQLAPQWLKAWLARTQALQAEAKARFADGRRTCV
jgi:hypothetical protein